jgi:hypothetical protein
MIQRERLTASIDGDFVVFLIGMRFNSWWKLHRWLPVAQAMPPFGLGKVGTLKPIAAGR